MKKDKNHQLTHKLDQNLQLHLEREGDETGILNDYTRNGSIIVSVDEKLT